MGLLRIQRKGVKQSHLGENPINPERFSDLGAVHPHGSARNGGVACVASAFPQVGFLGRVWFARISEKHGS